MPYLIPARPRRRRKPRPPRRPRRRPRRKPRPPRRKPRPPRRKPNPTPPINVKYRDNDSAAVIIGVEYVHYWRRKKMNRLPGCHSDAVNMNQLLQNRYGVPASNIKILADDGRKNHKQPTKTNILRALRSLLSSGKKHLWFTYSGHGSFTEDTGKNSDEPDRRDEMLVPSDFRSAGMILDDKICHYLAILLPSKEASFVAIYDCCHSGTMSDLPLSFSSKNPETGVQSSSGVKLNKKSGQILSLSACADSQTSVSAYNLDRRKRWAGALTHSFASLPKGTLTGEEILTLIDARMRQRHFSQITTISTNRLDVTHSNQITFPFPQIN